MQLIASIVSIASQSSTTAIGAAMACAALLAAPGARAQSPAVDPHRAEDQAKHQKIAAAHAAAARCLQANPDGAACHQQLQADCKGLAVGAHCGLRTQVGEHKDKSLHIGEHQRMATIHAAAAQCLVSTRAYRDCQAQLSSDCGGIGVGKYCGMRHAH